MFFCLSILFCLFYATVLSNHLHITCASLFVVCASIVRLFTQIVHCVWASCFLFVYYLWERCWIIYIDYAPLCLLLSGAQSYHLNKLCIVFAKDNIFMRAQIFTFEEASLGTFKLKDVNDLFSRNVKFASIYGLETWSWFNFVMEL